MPDERVANFEWLADQLGALDLDPTPAALKERLMVWPDDIESAELIGPLDFDDPTDFELVRSGASDLAWLWNDEASHESYYWYVVIPEGGTSMIKLDPRALDDEFEIDYEEVVEADDEPRPAQRIVINLLLRNGEIDSADSFINEEDFVEQPLPGSAESCSPSACALYEAFMQYREFVTRKGPIYFFSLQQMGSLIGRHPSTIHYCIRQLRQLRLIDAEWFPGTYSPGGHWMISRGPRNNLPGA